MPSDDEALQERRNDYDVTNTVDVSSPRSVRDAVMSLLSSVYPATSLDPVWVAFLDFERMYTGADPDFHGVDTSYHDMQHSLDVTLALSRLIAGFEETRNPTSRLGPDHATFALVAALFHDAGYLRHRFRDRNAASGAEFTRVHVTRSGAFLEDYLPRIGLDEFVPVVSRVVHYTGYELPLEQIHLDDDPRSVTVGKLLGTADLVAQLADRCYLEKCRDRLYPEFVLGGVAFDPASGDVRYRSGKHLLLQTLDFYRSSVHQRLERGFHGAYRHFSPYFGSARNPYVSFIRKNLEFLTQIKKRGERHKLRRRPPCVVPDPFGEARLMALALRRMREQTQVMRLPLEPDLEPSLHSPTDHASSEVKEDTGVFEAAYAPKPAPG